MIHLLAAGSANSSTLNDVEPGLLGFLVVAGLALALVVLLRSMNKQFRKIGPAPEDLDDADLADETADADAQESFSPGAAHRFGQAPPAQ